MEFPLAIPKLGYECIRIVRRADGKHVRLTNGRRHRAVGRYASIKMGNSVPWESRVELSDLYRAEVDPAVVSYWCQPETILWHAGVKRQRYTPDRIDLLADGHKRVVEIKDRFDAGLKPDYAEKLRQAAEIYAQLGYGFELRDRSCIIVEPEFSAVEEVQAYRRALVTTADAVRVQGALADGPLPFRDVLARLKLEQPRPVLFAMMVRRLVLIDLSNGIQPDAAVSLVERHQ